MIKSQLTKNQKKKYYKTIRYQGVECLMTVTVRYDDECGNGHNTFSITGTIKNPRHRDIECGGCIHDEIGLFFPELKHLIKWHLCNSDMPMYYIENTLYHASNSTSSKYKAGEPNQWDNVLKFKNSYITHKFSKTFIEYLQNNQNNTFEIIEIEHKKDSSYNYSPKYTFKGFECEWWQCPFDSKDKALEYKKELETKKWEIISIVTGYQEEKERDFAAARKCAIWEEVTDEQLSLPSEKLKKLLLKRLPKLMRAFKKDIESLGFTY